MRFAAARVRSHGALLGLGAAMVVSATLVLHEGRHMTFFNDEWVLILHRRGHDPSVFLRPVNEHLILVPIAIYKFLLAVFGASYTPFRVVSVALGLVCAGLVFRLVRSRAGDLPAFAAAAVLLFLGAAWEQIYWALGITYYCSLAAGLGMLLALERPGRRRDAAACVLLTVALASFSFGLAFAAAGTVAICLSPRARRWRRLWIALGPLVLYGVWALAYGTTEVTASNIYATPNYVLETASTAMASVTGLFRAVGVSPGGVGVFPPFDGELGRPLAILGAALLVYRLGRRDGVRPALWTFTVLALAVWASFALVAGPGRSPGASRYQYPDALLVLLLAAELSFGKRLSVGGRVVILALLAASVVANVASLRDGATFFTQEAEVARAELGAMELARETLPPGFEPEGPGTYPPAVGHFLPVDAPSYFSFTSKFGSPAASPAEIAGSSAVARESSDIVLVRGQSLQFGLSAAAPARTPAPQPEPGSAGVHTRAASGCLELSPGAGQATLQVTVPPGGLLLQAARGASAQIRMRRFGDSFSAFLGVLPPGARVSLVPRHDGSPRPWRALVTTVAGPVQACAL